MCHKVLLMVMTFLVMGSVSGNHRSPSNSWIAFMHEARALWYNCTAKNPSREFLCAKEASLDIFDQLVSGNVIPFTGFMRMVRLDTLKDKSFEDFNNTEPTPETHRRFDEMSAALSHSDTHSWEMTSNNLSWSQHILQKIHSTFDTHVLQIDLKPIGTNATGRQLRGRHRRRHQMLPMMVFGVTALGMVLVPIGFQFLAVLGGKALLLAKMALLLASLNGLKRVASSGVHYGLYHSVPDYHHPHGFYDRGDTQGPRRLLTGEGEAKN